MDLEWQIDSEGDYRVEYSLDDGRSIIVGIGAHTLGLENDVRIREIWAVAARIPGDFPGDLAENLLADTWSTRKFGAWATAGRTSDGREVLVYLARIPSDASAQLFRAALEDVAVSASDIRDALSELETGS